MLQGLKGFCLTVCNIITNSNQTVYHNNMYNAYMYDMMFGIAQLGLWSTYPQANSYTCNLKSTCPHANSSTHNLTSHKLIHTLHSLLKSKNFSCAKKGEVIFPMCHVTRGI